MFPDRHAVKHQGAPASLPCGNAFPLVSRGGVFYTKAIDKIKRKWHRQMVKPGSVTLRPLAFILTPSGDASRQRMKTKGLFVLE